MKNTQTTRKATHSGTCQLCGRSQMLPKGTLSLHGYTTRWGFFSGVCPGSKHLPFEQSIDLIQGAIARVEGNIADHVADIAKLSEPPTGTVAWIHVYVPATWTVRKSSYAWKRAEVTIDARGFAVAAYEVAETNGGTRTKFAEFGYAKTVAEAVAYGNNQRIGYHTAAIKNLREYVKWQTERIAGWKPSELKKLNREGDRKGPLVHARGNYWYANAKLCAGSAMIAQMDTSPKTDNVAEVTCPRCQKYLALKAEKAAAAR